jgi:transmembrane sensor
VNRVTREAARWFVRLQRLPSTDPRRSQFERWLAADPVHASEYSAIAALWQGFDSTATVEQLANALRQQKPRRRPALATGAIGALLIVVVSLLGWRGWSAWYAQPISELSLQTGPAQTIRQTMSDGSLIVLNARSRAHVTYFRDRREVELIDGEALFEVTHDADRPFTVSTHLARIRDLGTRFNIHRTADRVRVAVTEGTVDVTAASGAPLVLQAGEVAEVVANAAPTRVGLDADDAVAWTRGQLLFRSVALEEFAASLSRYRSRPLTVEGPSPSTRITAVVQIANLETFLITLPDIAPVRLREDDDATVIVPTTIAGH